MHQSHEPIAIIGSACHFSGDATSPSRLWELLKDPQDVRREIPKSRFSARGFYHQDHSNPGHSNVMHSYLLNQDVSAFDAEFFGIKPVEANAIDPQQRLLLETVYEALEAAGLTVEGLQGSDTSVYGGLMCNDYESLLLRDLTNMPTYLATGTSRAMLSNRISHFFDWHGPSMTIDTACSSSLVAVHLALQTLRGGDSRVAIACGSNLILGPENYIVESKLKMLSPDGTSRMWDQDANGYARGDGVAAIVLKTLSAALEDGDDIECIIRGTGVNQDGATPGITTPSSSAQEALIRSTYAKAGLQPLTKPEDRPQFFEAHGTGTPAGDPIEAEAIQKAFAADKSPNALHVGSIKTVLGHTEGTAGLAGIIKASLALQHGILPPNLHLKVLNPRVACFTKGLEVVQSAKPWPVVNGPRRASVNSFGFGGSNAHAILESYPGQSDGESRVQSPVSTPFVFSAASEHSLRDSLAAHASYLDQNPSVNPHDLAWTLRKRRSHLSYGACFTAESVEDLKTQITTALSEQTVGVKASGGKLLGIFTGQGAQYARLGAELIETSLYARTIIDQLEMHLEELPAEYRPSWSLTAELLAPKPCSRIHKATISQPLCVAVQILLVDLLSLADVRLDTVIGHSSGEIGAAYAAGVLSARDALWVAHLRGISCLQASSHNGEGIKGSMIAVGTSMNDALELCNDEVYAGRLSVAASNSSTSVTISGDEDAIEELEILLDDEKLFHRRLRVDKAYHSSHMGPCYEPYVQSLRRVGIQAQPPKCQWFSTVHGKLMDNSETGLSDTYWAENMTRPVLFAETLRVASLSFNWRLVLEVGPHPALQGPAVQTIQETLGKSLDYQGTLNRGRSSILALSQSLGALWLRTPVDLDVYERTMSCVQEPGLNYKLVKGLPSYSWNHANKYWAESSTSRRMRLRQDVWHALLGHESPDSSPKHLRWRNRIRPTEEEHEEDYGHGWLTGHCVQGQMVFPAAGYIATALEAALKLPVADAPVDSKVKLVEIWDLVIHEAISLSTRVDSGIEILVELSDISLDTDRITARFTYSAVLGNSDMFILAASANLHVLMGKGEPDVDLLPSQPPLAPHMVTVESQRFYSSLANLGYDYSGRFRSLTNMRRKHGVSSCDVELKATTRGTLLAHPADLDAAFQSLLLAYSYPQDDQLDVLHLPQSIGLVRINPHAIERHSMRLDQSRLAVNATVLPQNESPALSSPGAGFVGNIDIFTDSCHGAIQIQHVQLVPLGASNRPREIFTEMKWFNMEPNGDLAASNDHEFVTSHAAHAQRLALERIAMFYLGEFDAQVPSTSSLRMTSQNATVALYLEYTRHQLQSRPVEWKHDTLSIVKTATKEFEDIEDVKIMHLVGQTMPHVFKGETTMLEQFRETGLLDDYYSQGFASAPSVRWQAGLVDQIARRHPHLNMLEIGAGTGGATKSILGTLDRRFQSYTFTDVSAGFFGPASAALAAFQDRLAFKTLDIEVDPVSQGFEAGSYDIVIASFVLHATSRLESTLTHARKLLRPGGWLIVAEGSLQCLPSSFIFGTLSGWWLGRGDEGRHWSPHLSAERWNSLLCRTGFSGIDTRSPEEWEHVLGVCLFASQAIDEKVQMLRSPLSAQPRVQLPGLAIIGGQTPAVADIINEIRPLVEPFCGSAHVFSSLTEVDYTLISDTTPVLSLTDLDKPVFQDMTEHSYKLFRRLFQHKRALLWVKNSGRDTAPYSNMVVGFGRTAMHETEGLCLQHLDLVNLERKDTARTIAETLLRLLTKHENKDNGLQWTVEPEIAIDENGNQRIPRLQPLKDANYRYNSGRRTVVREIDIRKMPVAIKQDAHGAITVEALANIIYSNSEEPGSKLQVCFASSQAIITPLGHRFLILGTDTTGNQHLALTSSLASIIDVSSSCIRPLSSRPVSEAILLAEAASYLVAATIVDPLFPGQTIVVHNPSTTSVSHAIVRQTREKGVNVAFVADNECQADLNGLNVIRLPVYASQEELWRLLPRKAMITCFVSFASNSKTRDALFVGLPSWCRIETPESLYTPVACDSGANNHVLGDLLENTMAAVTKSRFDIPEELEIISLEKAVQGKIPARGALYVLDLTSLGTLPVKIARVDAAGAMFKANKTYWVVGLSGALGISLCDWMIKTGARNLVLSSRNPQIDPAWVDSHSSGGVEINIMPCDITDFDALNAVYTDICDNHPPIAGVINGAMVLRDSTIKNMSFDQLNEVVRPKVLGSINLDRLFNVHHPLDVFILLSSINAIIGNPGQANYAAANMFQCALAASRRRRGLVGVALNVGAIIGAGYIQRSSTRVLDLTVAKGALMHLSEEDFHQLVAEAVFACHQRDGPSELSTGLQRVARNTTEQPLWFSDPKFAHLINKVPSSNNTPTPTNSKSQRSLQEQVQSCGSRDELEALISQAFASQLRRDLQMATPDEELMQMRGPEIGLDSLVSVDIRSWFLKQLGVSIPVLRIMTNDTMASLVAYAVNKMLPSDSSSSGDVPTPSTVSFDWDLDTLPPALDADLAAQIESHSSFSPGPALPPRTIILTGATGLLGHHLVYHLAETTDVRIICIAVRRPPASSDSRIAYLTGDLGLPLLGLSQSECVALFATADAVVHVGADTSHLKPYAALREANVDSTAELVRLCLPRKIPLHYVSSVGVGFFSDAAELKPEKVNGAPSSLDDSVGGYTVSKWVCERLLERTSEFHGLPVWIHRPSTIIREGPDLVGEKAALDWMNGLLTYVKALRAVPEIKHIRGALDLVSVHTVCEQITQCVLGQRGNEGVTYMHQVGDVIVPLDRMQSLVPNHNEAEPVAVLPMAEWIALAVADGLHPSVAALIEGMDGRSSRDFPRLMKAA